MNRAATLYPIVGSILIALTTPAAAQETEPGAPDRWKVAAELSFTDQSGNRELRLLTGGLRVSHLQKEDFEMEALLQSRYGESSDEVIARNHFASLSLDVHPREIWSPFFFLTAERDPFKRLDARLAGGAGAKYTAYRSDDGNDEASLSLALLYSYENLRPTAADPFGPARTLARWSMRVRGKQEVNEQVTLQHVTFYQPEWDQVADYLLRSETGAKVLLTERLALSVSYQLDRTARPPQGVSPDDRLFKTGLIIDF